MGPSAPGREDRLGYPEVVGEVRVEAPADIRDLVWLPAEFVSLELR